MNGIEGDINSSPARNQWYKTIAHGDTMRLLGEDARHFLHQSMSTPCLDVLSACEGIYLIDLQGKKYMDFHGNNVHQVGHRNSFVIDRVKKQMDILPFSPRRYTNAPTIELAQKLGSLLSGDLNRVLFAPGGTSAISMALKLARVVTGKQKIISFWDSFHGASLDTISIGGEREFKQHMGLMMPGIERIPPPMTYRGMWANEEGNDLMFADYLEYIIEKEGDIGACIMETVRNTDVQIPSKSYWQRVRDICTRHGVLLILDEIPIAFGRTGKMFAFEHYGIEPDILCLGKGLGAGIIPMAAMIARDSYNIAVDSSLGHFTHEKNPLGSVAALAMLEFIDLHHILDKVKEDEKFVKLAFKQLKNQHQIIGDVRGIGLLWGIELVQNRHSKLKANAEAEKVMYSCLEQGLSFKVSQGNVLQLSPPLTITRNQLQEAITILDNALMKLNQ